MTRCRQCGIELTFAEEFGIAACGLCYRCQVSTFQNTGDDDDF